MKTRYFLMTMAAAALSWTTGCKDSFLEVESPINEFIDTYFTTDAHVQEAIVSAYNPLVYPDWYNDQNGMAQYAPVNIMSDIMADQIWVGGADKTDNQFWHLMMNYEATPNVCLESLWSIAYQGIKRCNDVITYIGWAGADITPANQQYYEAQVRVLRVFYYNWLWKFWGNVPYYTVNLSGNFLSPQNTADEVYDGMITDLEGALALNALPFRASNNEAGRVTKAMAYMLYAEIVMYQKDTSRYPTALQYMQEIINSPDYDLVEDYATIFTEAGEWSKESIWEINYTDDNASRSYSNTMYPGGTVLPRLIGPNNYAAGSGDTHQNGWGFAPVRQETVDLFADGDARKLASCWNAAATGTFGARYQNTDWFIEKYAPYIANNADQIADTDLNFNNNLRIYRYAETLLNAAELLLATGGSATTAGDYLNQVHHRAGLTDNLTATVETILQERALEFVGEGKRYWDLIRTGKAATVLVPDSYGYRTNSWTESKKHLPIPQREIDASQGTLTQNKY